MAAAQKDLSVVRQGLLLDGKVPPFLDPPKGCRIRLWCSRSQTICAEVEPILQEVEPARPVACHFPLVALPPFGDRQASENGQPTGKWQPSG